MQAVYDALGQFADRLESMIREKTDSIISKFDSIDAHLDAMNYDKRRRILDSTFPLAVEIPGKVFEEDSSGDY